MARTSGLASWGAILVSVLLGGACTGNPDSSTGNPAGGPEGGLDGAAGPVACRNRQPTVSWSLSPFALHIAGTVTAVAVNGAGGAQLVVTDDLNVAHDLVLQIPWAPPLTVGDPIEVTVAERRVFRIYRTLEIKKRDAVVAYLSEVAQPSLPPPVQLEVADVVCSASYHESVKHHAIRASAGGSVVLDVGQEAEVGGFRVLNDLAQSYPEGTFDVIDTLGVAIVSVR